MRAIDLKHVHQDLRSMRDDVRQRLSWCHPELRDEWFGLEGELKSVAFDDEPSLTVMRERLHAFRIRLA